MDEAERRILNRLELVMDRLEPILLDHETRLRTLEKRMWYDRGAFAVILTVVAYVLKG